MGKYMNIVDKLDLIKVTWTLRVKKEIEMFNNSTKNVVSSIGNYKDYNGKLAELSFFKEPLFFNSANEEFELKEIKRYYSINTSKDNAVKDLENDYIEEINEILNNINLEIDKLYNANEVMSGLCKELNEFMSSNASDEAKNSLYNKYIKSDSDISKASDKSTPIEFKYDDKTGIILIMQNGKVVGVGNPKNRELPTDKGKIYDYLSWAFRTAHDNEHGYSQASRNGSPDYDCSSYVYYALKNSGITVPEIAFTTWSMKQDLSAAGFDVIYYSSNEELEPGDILVNTETHTEIYVGNNQTIGAHSNKDGASGDSGGNEICVVDAKKYQYALRYNPNKK